MPVTRTSGSTEAPFFQSRVTKKTKLQSSTSLAAFTPRKKAKVSRFYLLPPHNGDAPSPTPCTLYPLPCMGINKLADVVACRLPQGVPLRRQIFLSSTPCRATSCKPHTHDDVLSASAVKSPSNAFNLVGRWLLLAETCSRRPSRKRPRVGLLSLAAPADCAQANPTGDFAAKNIKSRRSDFITAFRNSHDLKHRGQRCQ